MNYIEESKPNYITVKEDQFIINNTPYKTFRCLIQKAQLIRKYFRNGKLLCYSMDAKLSHKQKKYCIFCDDKYACHRKIRLSLIIIEQGEVFPAILDITQPSFQEFQNLTDEISVEELQCTPITLKIVYDENDKKHIEFIK